VRRKSNLKDKDRFEARKDFNKKIVSLFELYTNKRIRPDNTKPLNSFIYVTIFFRLVFKPRFQKAALSRTEFFLSDKDLELITFYKESLKAIEDSNIAINSIRL
jgi:hypothetical protein